MDVPVQPKIEYRVPRPVLSAREDLARQLEGILTKWDLVFAKDRRVLGSRLVPHLARQSSSV